MDATHVLLTGCSAGGKSTLLAELARRGYRTVAEPGRRVISAERAQGGDGLPWENPLRFARACLAMAEDDLRRAGPGVTVFDRGVIDAALALRRQGVEAPADRALGRSRYQRVFLAPPWRALFDADPDPDRRHDFDAAVAEYDDIVGGLGRSGYAPLVLPKVAFAARADWFEWQLRGGAGAG